MGDSVFSPSSLARQFSRTSPGGSRPALPGSSMRRSQVSLLSAARGYEWTVAVRAVAPGRRTLR